MLDFNTDQINNVVEEVARTYIRDAFHSSEFLHKIDLYDKIQFYFALRLFFQLKQRKVEISIFADFNNYYATPGGADIIDVTNYVPKDFDFTTIDKSVYENADEEVIVVPAQHFMSEDVIYEIQNYAISELNTKVSRITDTQHTLKGERMAIDVFYER